MGSVGFGEIALIALVALLVFGPDRLPELSRKAGELLTKAREATRSFTDALDNEFDDATSPIRSLQAEYHATKDELTSAAGTILNFDESPDSDAGPDNPTDETPPPSEQESTTTPLDDSSPAPDHPPAPTADDEAPPPTDHPPAPTADDEAAE
jgi:sec-independent protein translocase protein TatB